MTEPHVAGFAIIVGADHHPLQRKQINMNKLKPETGDKLRLTTRRRSTALRDPLTDEQTRVDFAACRKTKGY
jgi:hypothetical protein